MIVWVALPTITKYTDVSLYRISFWIRDRDKKRKRNKINNLMLSDSTLKKHLFGSRCSEWTGMAEAEVLSAVAIRIHVHQYWTVSAHIPYTASPALYSVLFRPLRLHISLSVRRFCRVIHWWEKNIIRWSEAVLVCTSPSPKTKR